MDDIKKLLFDVEVFDKSSSREDGEDDEESV